WATPSPPIFTMLGRLLALRRDAPVPGVRIARDQGALLVHAAHSPGAVLYAAVRRGDAGVGLLRVVLPADAGVARAPWPADLPGDATFEALLVDASPDRPERSTSDVQVVFVARDAPTSTLPLGVAPSHDVTLRGAG